MHYINIAHPITFDGRASFTRGLVFFETRKHLIGVFHWVMFDRGHVPVERCFVVRKDNGMPRKG